MLSAPAGRRFTTRAVAKRNDVGPRTVERWERDPRLGFPKPTYVRGRKYWDETDLIVWERNMAARSREIITKQPDQEGE